MDESKLSAKAKDAQVLSTQAISDGLDARWVKLVKISYKDPLGRARNWESAERTTRPANAQIDGVGVVAILKYSSGPEILLQKQFRPPVGKVCIELPAGLLDAGETAEACALRELKEETGYIGEITSDPTASSSGVLFNDPGFTNTNLKLIHVGVDPSLPANLPENRRPQLEENEFIETFSVPLDKFWAESLRLESEEGCAIDARVGTLAEGYEMAKRWKQLS